MNMLAKVSSISRGQITSSFCFITLVLSSLLITVQAGPIIVTQHQSVATVTLENLDKDIDDLGLMIGEVSNTGAILSYSSNSLNERQLVRDPFIRYEDRFGTNVGSYEASIQQSGSGDGFSYSSYIASVNAAGTRSPLVSLDASVDTYFRVAEDTQARINISVDGNTNGGRNFVGLQIDGNGDSGQFERLYTAASSFGLQEITGSDSRELTLKSGFTYHLSGESNGSTLYSGIHDGPAPPSNLMYSILTTQTLVDNDVMNSLKPGASNYTGPKETRFTHQFLLDSEELNSVFGQTVWLDPEVAVGYDYLIDGADLLGIELPGLDVFDNFSYQLFDLSGNFIGDLFAGDTYNFSVPVNGFSLRGIDPKLGLDPKIPGFTLGLLFGTTNMSTVLVEQIPRALEININNVPVPNLWLMYLIVGLPLIRFTRFFSWTIS